MAKIIGSFSAPGDMQIRQMRDCERLPDARPDVEAALREMLLLLSCVSFGKRESSLVCD
jgi:hypothetical protein